MRQEKLIEIRNDILREMYQEAEPPLDFDYALENPDEMEEGWFGEHYLSDEKQSEIFDKHIDQHPELTNDEISSLNWTCILDLGPTNVEDE